MKITNIPFLIILAACSQFANKYERALKSFIVLLIIIALSFWAASCTIIKPEEKEMQIEYLEFDDYARKIHHVNDRKDYTASLNWADVRALDIDSVTEKFIEYRKYHLHYKARFK